MFNKLFPLCYKHTPKLVDVAAVCQIGLLPDSCNILGILTSFERRPDDGHVRAETCSLTHTLKHDVSEENCFIILVLIFFNVSPCIFSIH